MKQAIGFFAKCVLAGLLLVLPIYLAIIVLLKGMGSIGKLIQPFTHLLPGSFPAGQVLSLLLTVLLCFLIGAAIHTRLGRWGRERLERSVIEKIPGYTLFRSLSQQLAGGDNEKVWKPALVEIEEALVPAFIIEYLADGRYTVFVPSIPTPFAGASYVMEKQRVHPVDVPFADAIKVITKWGAGTSQLVAAMEKTPTRD
jgi:uncharacterized membrane protein